jgi:hypothetical protein
MEFYFVSTEYLCNAIVVPAWKPVKGSVLSYIFISPKSACYLIHRIILLLPRHVSVHLYYLQGLLLAICLCPKLNSHLGHQYTEQNIRVCTIKWIHKIKYIQNCVYEMEAGDMLFVIHRVFVTLYPTISQAFPNIWTGFLCGCQVLVVYS